MRRSPLPNLDKILTPTAPPTLPPWSPGSSHSGLHPVLESTRLVPTRLHILPGLEDLQGQLLLIPAEVQAARSSLMAATASCLLFPALTSTHTSLIH